jgi:nitrogen regulatory protein P-II 2
MKLIIAYIQPEALTPVKQALYEKEIFKLSVTNALGCGQQKGYHENYRGADLEVNLLKKVRLEVAVNDDHVDATIKSIIKGAKTGETGKIGDGKIFVLELGECIRIRTGEKGSSAIG